MKTGCSHRLLPTLLWAPAGEGADIHNSTHPTVGRLPGLGILTTLQQAPPKSKPNVQLASSAVSSSTPARSCVSLPVINLMCHLEWAIGYPDTWSNTFLGISGKVILNEINI